MELDEEPYKRVEQVKKIDKMMMEPVSIFLFMWTISTKIK